MSNGIEAELSKLREEFGVQIERAIQENGNALGRALKQRFEALEAIVLMLALNSPTDVQKAISQEIAKRKASWLK